jgi:2Fe-2S ferredoxin
MAKVTYIEHNGTAHAVEVPRGMSVMEAAVQHDIPGIDGNCGGACACATCHVYVDPAWLEAVGPCDEVEQGMLEFSEDVRPNSRLACQIKVTADLDGLLVTMPKTQG